MIRVLGAGIIGLAVAEELLRRGHDVEVVDPAPASGASYAAAGMLAPAGELWHGEESVHAHGRASAELWPEYAARLGVPLPRVGTLLAAADHGDLQVLDRQVALARAAGEDVVELDRHSLLAHEPRLGRVVGGALLPRDHSVDPRAVLRALLARVHVRPRPTERPVSVTVVATGAALPAPYSSLVRGVRGEILRLRCPDPADLPDRTVRAWVRGEQVYVVPRPGPEGGGEVVVGATQLELAGEPAVTVEGAWRLLDTARRLLPGLDRAVLVEATARDRPGTADNRPLIGPTGDPAVVLAAGHFRHGVLLAPLTARLVADHLEHGRVEPDLDPRRLLLDPSLEGTR